jgi:hypothetical protein
MEKGEQPIHPQTPESWSVNMSGLTKREHFAAMAMQGIMANMSTKMTFNKHEGKAALSVEIADALLKELDK